MSEVGATNFTKFSTALSLVSNSISKWPVLVNVAEDVELEKSGLKRIRRINLANVEGDVSQDPSFTEENEVIVPTELLVLPIQNIIEPNKNGVGTINETNSRTGRVGEILLMWLQTITAKQVLIPVKLVQLDCDSKDTNRAIVATQSSARSSQADLLLHLKDHPASQQWGLIYSVPLNILFKWGDVDSLMCDQNAASLNGHSDSIPNVESSNGKDPKIGKNRNDSIQLKDKETQTEFAQPNVTKPIDTEPSPEDSDTSTSIENKDNKNLDAIDEEEKRSKDRKNHSVKNKNNKRVEKVASDKKESWTEVVKKTFRRRAPNREPNKHNMTTRSQSEDSRPERVELLGNCFANHNDFEDCSVDGINPEDQIIASRKFLDQLFGKVTMICKIPELKRDEIFVGVEFEHRLFGNPFEIKHLYENKYECEHKWNCATNVLIPASTLFSECYEEDGWLHILRQDENAKLLEKIYKTDLDYSKEAARDEEFKPETIDFSEVQQGNFELRGIEGYNNSCYADSTIFILFAFTNVLDSLLDTTGTQDLNVEQKAIINILKFDIINKLRLTGEVEWAAIQKLRIAVSKILDDALYRDKFMDVEEFMIGLFDNILQARGFLKYDSEQDDFIFQVFPPHNEKTPEDFPMLEDLVVQNFSSLGVKLLEIPNPFFIIKLPISNGVPAFSKILINSHLSIENLVLGSEAKWMSLKAVICLDAKHFTCFVRTGKKSNWVYHDSMPGGTDGLRVRELPRNFRRTLNNSSYLKEEENKTLDPETNYQVTEADYWVEYLQRTAYVCIYEPRAIKSSSETNL